MLILTAGLFNILVHWVPLPPMQLPSIVALMLLAVSYVAATMAVTLTCCTVALITNLLLSDEGLKLWVMLTR